MIAVGKALRIDPGMLATWSVLRRSRLGLYVHERTDDDAVILRELVTGLTRRCLVPAGYLGTEGELWLARVVPPPAAGTAVAFITPYVVLTPGVAEWLAYLERTLPKVPGKKDRRAGPTPSSWSACLTSRKAARTPGRTAALVGPMPSIRQVRRTRHGRLELEPSATADTPPLLGARRVGDS